MHQVSKTIFCHKTLHVSGIFCAHHQKFSTVHTAVGMFHASYVTASEHSQVGTPFQPDSDSKFWIIDASSCLFYTKLVTMHSHLNIKLLILVYKGLVSARHQGPNIFPQAATWPLCPKTVRC
jgi:hypothetical protein